MVPETSPIRPRNKLPSDQKLCHPGLSGSLPKRVAVWWGDLSRDPVFSSPKTTTRPPKQPPLYNPYPRSSAPLSAYICVNRLSRDPVFGVAKSVCHRDRRSLPNRQLRCLCRTDFGSPLLDNRIKYPIHSSISFIPPALAATCFSAIILRSSLTGLRMTAGRPPASQVLQMRPIPLYNI